MNEDISKSVMKSGTSIVGIVCKDAVILAGDRRATAGNLILTKNAKKVVPINDYIVVAGTGVASDIDMSQRIIAAELKLKELKIKRSPTVKEAASLIGMVLYRNIRSPSMIPSIVGLLVAGVNKHDGTTELYSVEPAGGVYKIEDYDANFSSGMPFILGLLERQYKPNLSVPQAIELAKECIKSSTQRDSGSGNGIDIFTITKDGIKQAVSQQIKPNYE